jgi:hypothetical protein
MRHLRSSLLTLIGLLSFLTAGRAQEITLETRADASVAFFCQMLHSTTCAMVHVENSTTLSVGAALQLDGNPYVITWTGPGYYLATGVVLEAQGEAVAALKGQRWVEVKPQAGRAHLSGGWKDKDGNGALSVADTLTLEDGAEVEIKDVRLHVRAKRVPKP